MVRHRSSIVGTWRRPLGCPPTWRGRARNAHPGVLLAAGHSPGRRRLMAVDPAVHRSVGRALVGALERDLAADGVRLLQVRPRGRRVPIPVTARRGALYEAMGFERSRRHRLVAGNPCLFMVSARRWRCETASRRRGAHRTLQGAEGPLSRSSRNTAPSRRGHATAGARPAGRRTARPGSGRESPTARSASAHGARRQLGVGHALGPAAGGLVEQKDRSLLSERTGQDESLRLSTRQRRERGHVPERHLGRAGQADPSARTRPRNIP